MTETARTYTIRDILKAAATIKPKIEMSHFTPEVLGFVVSETQALSLLKLLTEKDFDEKLIPPMIGEEIQRITVKKPLDAYIAALQT